jgi:hypothetical protein
MSYVNPNYAARIVAAIHQGDWTSALPSWSHYFAGQTWEVDSPVTGNVEPDYVRAVWTAEAFIHLFAAANPRFDQHRFLVACGLADNPKLAGRS